MSKFVSGLVDWFAEIIRVNYDDKKCGLKEFNTTLGHIVLISTLFSGCVSVVVVCLYQPSTVFDHFLTFACMALPPLTLLFLLTFANLLYIVSCFPRASGLSDIAAQLLRASTAVGCIMLVVGLGGVGFVLFTDALTAHVAKSP